MVELNIYPPDAENPLIDLNIQNFMGTWYVVHSTLPLWKSRKDVTITYTLKEMAPSNENVLQFDDVVEYRSKSDPPDSKRSRIIGVDSLQLPPSASDARSVHPPQTRYKWRGKGLLMIASSRWQVLGYSDAGHDGEVPAWALTYFEKTLFTPAGLDIYSRTAEGLPEHLVKQIISKVQALGGEVGTLANRFFEVERSPEPDARGPTP